MKENFKPSPITVLQNTDLLIKALERSNVPIGGSCIVESVDTKIRMKIKVQSILLVQWWSCKYSIL